MRVSGFRDAATKGAEALTAPEDQRSPWENAFRRITLLMGGLLTGGAVLAMIVSALRTVTPAASADEALELIEVEYADVPIEVEADPEAPEEYFELDETDSRPEMVLPIEVTLRNNTDNSAVLTAVRVEVEYSVMLSPCEEGVGGTFSTPLLHDFRFEDLPWADSSDREFEVEPRDADQFSITIGPDGVQGLFIELWRFSVFGESKDQRLAHWADGVGAEISLGLNRESLLELAQHEVDKGVPIEEVRACAEDQLVKIRSIRQNGKTGGDFYIEHPGLDGLVEAYEGMASYGL